MTEIQKEYTELLNEVSKKGWKDDKTFRIGYAGAAVVISFLNRGDLKLKTLAEDIPDFTQSEIRVALQRLKRNGYFSKEKRKNDFGYVLHVDDDAGIESTIWWGLMINVANGFIERKK
jgi:transcription initiation factor IIE alpha subunit